VDAIHGTFTRLRDLAGMKILYVEDDPVAREYIHKGLREHGFVVDVASDGKTGFERAVGGAYDLLLLDVMLPERDGFDLLRELRKAGIDSIIVRPLAGEGMTTEDTLAALGEIRPEVVAATP
jgi:DNA-binding response OmpR family regulator